MGRRSVAVALLAVFAAAPALASPRRRQSLHRPATKLHVELSLDEEGRPQYSIARTWQVGIDGMQCRGRRIVPAETAFGPDPDVA
jgi:hypothetical protein